ncbi:MAG: phosphodiester glycosidase family protein [Armatimonadota bacterium]|nr:phosphodiester glycosidase family protein [Armatimonadota bacterium]
MDGGGSTTLVVGGAVLNRPSDEGGERPVSDALVVLPKGLSIPPSRPAGRWAGTGRQPWPPPPGP